MVGNQFKVYLRIIIKFPKVLLQRGKIGSNTKSSHSKKDQYNHWIKPPKEIQQQGKNKQSDKHITQHKKRKNKTDVWN